MHLAYAKIGAITYHDPTLIITGVMPGELMEVVRDFGVESVHLVARDARILSHMAEQQGKTLREAFFPNLKRGDLTGEIAMSMREYHHKCWGATMTNLFAVSDTLFCGSSCNEGEEREVGRFMHLPEDEFFVEALDLRTGKPVEGLEFGEPVITNLFSEAMAYIRWRTEDAADIRWDPCPYCGYTHMREFVRSRISETIDVKGKLIPMGDVEDFVYSRPESRPLPIQIIREEPQPQDKLRVRLCYHENLVKEPEQYARMIEDGLKKRLGVETSVELISPQEVRLAAGWKFVRVVTEKRQS
jgi:phenylacetate-coenzyme A ligase PaaK-like adenylate-forming protein